MKIRPLLLVASLAAASCAQPPARTNPAGAQGDVHLKKLVLMLDGVPFQLVDSLWTAGHFREFSAPSRVVSAFPSLTGVSFGEMWHERPDGYEHRWFDTEQNRIRGGLMEHVVPTERPEYDRQIDIRANGLSAGLAYLLPGPFAAGELRGLRSALATQIRQDSIVIAYLVSTDALAHRAGREAVVQALLEVEGIIAEVRRRAPEAEILLFSDHGNDLVRSKRVDLEGALEAAGFNPSRRLSDSLDVVVPRFGLVGSAFLYVRPESEAAVAEALVGTDGVDLVIRREGDGRVHIASRRGDALLDRDGARFRYHPVSGDPLGLAPAVERMRRTGALDSGGFASDSAWLQATMTTPYIDSLRRLLFATGPGVRHPASLIVSFEVGYHFGASTADALVNVTGTHGSLLTSSSLAFFMTTSGRPPALLRGADLIHWLPVPEPPPASLVGDGRGL